MKRLVLLGTSHSIQRDERGCGAAFEAHLTALCRQFAIRAVGEEMNRESLARTKAAQSVGERIANLLGIPHVYCDPTLDDRSKLGTTTVPEIEAEAWRLELSDTEKATRLAGHWHLVEGYWLDRIAELDVWPMLFICGADHVESLSRRAAERGHEVVIADEDWGA